MRVGFWPGKFQKVYLVVTESFKQEHRSFSVSSMATEYESPRLNRNIDQQAATLRVLLYNTLLPFASGVVQPVLLQWENLRFLHC
ncbi:hypothetical protein NIES4103_35550 [Nostoc sp. NIES-4103]|nr:hypothetical protein NIES4103_35550 [Nostoc sp. NIES-4103]